jgi:hypothetical protein
MDDIEGCNHLHDLGMATPSSNGCEDCLRIGAQWLHLRMCMNCGHVGCCDDSPLRHATEHFSTTGHPVIQSFEPGEDWWFCYVDGLVFVPAAGPSFAYS